MLCTALAWGQAEVDAPTVVIEARVSDDLSAIEGTLRFTGDPTCAFVDPLAVLPDPTNDLQGFRTFPGAPDHGTVRFEDGDFAQGIPFETLLPRRFGDVGTTHHGLMANGAWYPQAVCADGLPVAAWHVTVTLPQGAVGALGSSLGPDTLTWTGHGERASLAVVPHGHITQIPGTEVWWLTRGRPGGRVLRELSDNLALVPIPLSGAVVEAPLRRRLVRAGPQLAYLSARAFRVTPGLEFVHRSAVVQGLLEAWLPVADPFERQIAAAGIADVHQHALAGIDADRVLGFFRWVPRINALLSSRRIAYYSEILGRPHPGDPVRDDLVEALDPHSPGSVVAAQLDARYGPGTATDVGADLWMGESVASAAERHGVDAAWVDSWRAPYPRQDYRLDVHKGLSTVVITRYAPADAQLESVGVRVDGQTTDHLFAPGVTEIELDDPPRRVRFDPAGVTAQTSRTGERWPPRYDITLAGWIDTINLSQQQVFVTGFATLRRRYDTHNLFLGSLSTSRQDLISANVGYLRREGGLQDGISRPHRWRLNLGTSVLNPEFAETDGIQLAVDGFARYAWDTRISGDFPVRGRRLGASVGGGVIPGTIERWGNATLFATGVVSAHPRHAVATRGTATLAGSTVPHRLLTLGGPSAMRSIPTLPACPAIDTDTGVPLPCTELATERLVVLVEYRWAALRNLSVPMGIVWGSELQLAAGVEGVVARVDGQAVTATGVTAGVLGLGDMLGVETSGAGVTLAWPLWWHGIEELERTPVPQLYLKFQQAF